MLRIILPPGPMIAPIFSGSILIMMMRGAWSDSSARGLSITANILFRIESRASCACISASRRTSCRTPLDLDVHLESGNALGRAGHLEIHVPQVVFHALDVGEDRVPVALQHQAHGDAGHRRMNGHTRVHEGQGAAADAGHGRRAVGRQDFRHQANGVGELLFRGDYRQERPLGPMRRGRSRDGRVRA